MGKDERYGLHDTGRKTWMGNGEGNRGDAVKYRGGGVVTFIEGER